MTFIQRIISILKVFYNLQDCISVGYLHLNPISLANLKRIIAHKLCQLLGNQIILRLKELKEIFRENFIDVEEDINRRRLFWRNQSGYL